MAKNRNSHAKRQRDAEKKFKAEAKQARRLSRKQNRDEAAPLRPAESELNPPSEESQV